MDYFTSVQQGNQSLHREYDYVTATPSNRRSLVKLFYQSFEPIGRRGDLLNIKEYHALLCLLCPDFPLELVQKTARIILTDDVMDCLVSFPDFLYAFQVQFVYEDFLKLCLEVYSGLLATVLRANSSQPTVVVVPTLTMSNSQRNETDALLGHHVSPDNVDARVFLSLLRDRLAVCGSHPSTDVLESVLGHRERVSYYEFITLVVKSSEVNAQLGVLPSRDALFGSSTCSSSAGVSKDADS